MPLIYPRRASATNLVTNGGFETNATGYVTFSNRSIARSTEQALFGSASLKVTADAAQASGGAATDYAHTFSGAGTYIVSAYIFIPDGWSGGNIEVQMNGYSVAQTSIIRADASITGQWQRIQEVRTIGAGDLVGQMRFAVLTSWGEAESFYIDGVQIESGSVATPYVETDGGSATRDDGLVISTPSNPIKHPIAQVS